MRALLVIPVLAVLTAAANPVPISGKMVLTPTYLNSERLLVSVTSTDAFFSGSFTFAADMAAPSNTIAVYLWLPEEAIGDPAVEAFWKAFGREDLLATNAVQWEVLDRTVGLQIRVGERGLKLGRGINYFSLTHHRPPQPSTLSPPEERMFKQRYQMSEPDRLDEPGFCLLTVVFVCDATVVSNRTPVTVNYRQPLVGCAAGARFFYMPVFDRVPDNIFTADTNRYSITFVARGCFLSITNGTQTATLGSGESAIFAPQRHKPFRAIATGRPNKKRNVANPE